MNSKILIVEDESKIRDILVYSLKREGYSILEASTGEEGIEIIKDKDIDLLLLDLMLPDISGYEVCKQVNIYKRIPIVMLTAKNDIVDKVLGLELGADDYITKPFDIREVVARIKVCLRRMDELKQLKAINYEEKVQNVIVLKNGIKLLEQSREVLKNEEYIKLKPKEYELLYILAKNRNIVFSREQLLDKIWGYDFYGDSRTVDVHIQRIRKKLGEIGDKSLIQTIFGIGYKMT